MGSSAQLHLCFCISRWFRVDIWKFHSNHCNHSVFVTVGGLQVTCHQLVSLSTLCYSLSRLICDTAVGFDRFALLRKVASEVSQLDHFTGLISSLTTMLIFCHIHITPIFLFRFTKYRPYIIIWPNISKFTLIRTYISVNWKCYFGNVFPMKSPEECFSRQNL